MRALMLVSLCLVAACSDEAEQPKTKAPAGAAPAAGQWETTFETTAFRSTDGKTPVVKATVGERITGSTCIAPGEEEKPAPALFVGSGYQCTYRTSYIRNGRVNAQLGCTREGANGEIQMSVSGTSTADTFEGTIDAASYLSGDGDFAQTNKITARRTGPTCQAPTAQAV